MEELVSARIFFSLASGASTIFLGLCMYFFSHSCCMFACFFTAKALQEIFPQI